MLVTPWSAACGLRLSFNQQLGDSVLEILEMISTRFVRRTKLVALTTLLAGGTVFGSMCTSKDIQKNVVAGTLNYVKGGATSFWDAFIPQDEIWEGFFNPSPTLFPAE